MILRTKSLPMAGGSPTAGLPPARSPDDPSLVIGMEAAGAPSLDASDALMVPIFAWAFGQLYFGWRYR